MTTIRVLPHPEILPEGALLEAEEGKSLCQTLLDNHIRIEHACDLQCACTTCHVYVREGLSALPSASEKEEDMLDRAWGLSRQSRLSCQVMIGPTPLTIEIPRYSINHAKEG